MDSHNTCIKIKELIKSNDLDIVKYYKPVIDMKMKLFPNMMVNMIIIGNKQFGKT